MTIIPFEEKKPIIKSIFCAENAILIGEVHLEEMSSVWFGTVLRADISPIYVGRKTQILEQVFIECSEIGESCLISHKAMIHNAIIGNNTLVGMNASIHDNAKIGQNCIIGAGATILNGTKIPPNSVVIGNPGRISRKITKKETEMIKLNVEEAIRKAKVIINSAPI
jgi:carbonic anhydrase/acetyltransferase-like protein (isoleucine patch superfamily)